MKSILNFAKIDKGKILMMNKPQKRELTESPTYQTRMHILQTLNAYEKYTLDDWQLWMQKFKI